MQSYKNISLKNYNTFGIEAQAQELTIFNHETEAEAFFKDHTIIKYLVIGSGSNLLFTSDYHGHILKMENKGIQIVDEIGHFSWVKVAAGEIWDDVVKWAVEHQLGGIENLSFIPGTIGASPVQNIGAYGVEFKDIFNSLEALEISTGEKRKFYLQELEFDYRKSIFKTGLKNKFLITSVVIKLRKNPIINLQYGRLKEESEKISDSPNPSIAHIRQAVINIRKSKLPDPKDIGNAGSFFKNPVISQTVHQQLISLYPDLISYPLADGSYKLAAAWLIDKAELKGISIGNAGIHQQHALILINKGNATGDEIQHLANYIQEKVKVLFKVDLEPEVLMV